MISNLDTSQHFEYFAGIQFDDCQIHFPIDKNEKTNKFDIQILNHNDDFIRATDDTNDEDDDDVIQDEYYFYHSDKDFDCQHEDFLLYTDFNSCPLDENVLFSEDERHIDLDELECLMCRLVKLMRGSPVFSDSVTRVDIYTQNNRHLIAHICILDSPYECNKDKKYFVR
jgi:hypothetical protein